MKSSYICSSPWLIMDAVQVHPELFVNIFSAGACGNQPSRWPCDPHLLLSTSCVIPFHAESPWGMAGVWGVISRVSSEEALWTSTLAPPIAPSEGSRHQAMMTPKQQFGEGHRKKTFHQQLASTCQLIDVASLEMNPLVFHLTAISPEALC